MIRDDFAQMIVDEFEHIDKLQRTKGRDYAGNEDVLLNFKRNAEALDLTPEQIWAAYAGKHWDAIQSYCKTGALTSEPIEGRLRDLIVYSLLMLAMVKERT